MVKEKCYCGMIKREVILEELCSSNSNISENICYRGCGCAKIQKKEKVNK